MTASTREGGIQPVRLTVGITAHRDLIAAEKPAIARLVSELFDRLEQRFPGTRLQALCPLAEGGERIFARVAVDRGIPLLVPLPLPRSFYMQDFADQESREEFEELCEQSTVFELPLRPGVSPEQVARPGHLRDSEYAQLGVFVSSHSQVLVAMWDGKPSDQLGGTAQIVHYRLYNIYPAPAATRPIGPEMLADDENDLAYHIACSRDRDDGAPASPLHPLQGAWLTGDPETPPQDEMPDRYAHVFAMTAEFNRDLGRLAIHRESAAPHLDGNQPAGVTRIGRRFTAVDQLANRYQRRLNRALRTTYTLAALMGIAFVGYSTLPEQPLLLYAFLGFFALGLCLYAIARRGDWHRKYLDYRVLSEGLRVQYYWALAGIGNAGDGRFAHENFLQKQDPELGWIRHVMRDVELAAGPPVDTGDRGLEFVLAHWIGNAVGKDDPGQLGYYTNKAEQRYRLHRLTERLGTLSLWSGMAVAVVLAIFSRDFDTATRTVLLLLMGLLPLLAAVRGAYSHKRADKELIKQYRFMARIFGNARNRLEATSGREDKREVLRVLGTASLDEHAEWILMHRERPLEQSRL